LKVKKEGKGATHARERLSEREIRYLAVLKKLRGKDVRLKDLSFELNVATPSAHEEVRHLQKKGMVVSSEGGLISLTEHGISALENIRAVHIALETILSGYGFSEEEACKSSHSFECAVPSEVGLKLYSVLGKPVKCPSGHDEC